MEKITDETRFETIIAGDKPVVAVFKATWCKDCHFIEPFMPDVEQKFSDLTFVELDRDELPDVFADQGVMGIPSFVAYKNGRELTRFVSNLRKTREEIELFLRRTEEVAALM